MKFLSKTIVGMLAVFSLAFALAACTPASPSGAKKDTQATKQLQDQASTVVGIPAIKNFTEKRLLKTLYELRDNPKLTTYTYFIDRSGNFHKICPTTSVGFGMPFSAQYTAPTIDKYYSNGGVITTHQPEPNQIYMPDSTSATWVICLGKDGKSLNPMYVEPQIIVMLEPRE